MELILELMALQKAALSRVKKPDDPKASDTPQQKAVEPIKEPTLKDVEKKDEKEAKFDVAGQSGKLASKDADRNPLHKFKQGDKVKIASGTDEIYGMHVGKFGTVGEHGYDRRYRDTFYNVKLDGGKKELQVYERDLQAE